MSGIVDHLAPLVGGTVHGDRIVGLPDGFIYASFTGAIRLERPGQVVTTLGSIIDGVAALAKAYRAAVGAGVRRVVAA